MVFGRMISVSVQKRVWEFGIYLGGGVGNKDFQGLVAQFAECWERNVESRVFKGDWVSSLEGIEQYL